MSTYTPDSWVIVELDTKQHGKIYKVLAGWYGGYLAGDEWKLSSGIESMHLEDDVYVMPQSSGSVYRIAKGNEHMSGIMGSVFSNFEKLAEENDFTIRRIEVSELPTELKI